MARASVPSWRKGVTRFLRGLHDHFVPHQRNGHVPHILRHHVLFGYATFLVLLKVLVVVSAVVLPSSSLYSSAVTPGNVISLTNQARRDAGIEELEVSVVLSKAAQAKARDMLNKQYFAHVSPDGLTPWSWIKGAGYVYSHAGENLAIDFVEAEGVQAGWMASPTHRANVLDPRYQELGVAVLQGEFSGHETFVVVQMFGAPKVVATTAVVAPTPAPTPTSTTTNTANVVAKTSEQIAIKTEPKVEVKPSATTQPVVVASKPVEPINLIPKVEAAVVPVTIDESSVVILPTENGYKISVTAKGVETMTAHLGDRWAELRLDLAIEDRWVGTVEAPAGGEDAYLLAMTTDGRKVAAPVAWVAPGATVSDVFVAAAPSRNVRLFGVLPVTGLEDRVRQIYVVSMVLLAGTLVVSLLAKFHMRRHTVMAHGLLVIFLAGILTIV